MRAMKGYPPPSKNVDNLWISQSGLCRAEWHSLHRLMQFVSS